ncbi:FHA domain-containing protein [Mycobacterium sp. 1164966.3]|uniref:FHA domain-containing protein n=1 Tax=Mycobacterium sp. 1164966.3 TaxID=1856861 RepID=UPI000A517CF0|nr:FHA domain-containing protein [Mycobacterium sp. 1164966.3]
MTIDHGAPPVAPRLAVQIGAETQTLDPRSGVAVIGRDAGAAMRITDDRISRWHLRLEPRRDGWEAIDTSTNGMYLDDVRRNSVLITGPTTIHLGAPDGIPVSLRPGQPIDDSLEVTGVLDVAEPDEDEWWEGETDPGVARAGRAVAARRNELELTQRSLARDKIINAGTLIAFEKGRSWPRRATLSKLEKVLNWPPGTIARIRSGAAAAPGAPAAAPSDQATEAFSDTVRAPLMAEAVELAMHSIAAAITALPDPSDPDFTPRASSILADLRKLEKVAANAARNAKGTPSVVLALSSVRRTYNDLMTRAAGSPRATLGQRLHGARHRAEISLDEAATAAGLPIDVLEDAESDRPIPQDAAEAITTLIAQLTMS